MTNITREQLEMAALAAGKRIVIAPLSRHDFEALDAETLTAWRPHTDPGDAARLAVRLFMIVDVDTDRAWARTGRERIGGSADHNGTDPDKLRAYCEAVMICAAAVGERMQLAQRTSATPEQVAGSLRAVDEYDAAKRGWV